MENASSEPTSIFVYSDLDDYGLRPCEFRVLGRVARRGNCTESVPNIARGCRMNKKTATSALKGLVALSVLDKEQRPGETCVYRVNPMSKWSKRPHPIEDPTQKNTLPPKRDEGQPKAGAREPTQTEGDKGNPSEGNPHKAFKGKASAMDAVNGLVSDLPQSWCRTGGSLSAL